MNWLRELFQGTPAEKTVLRATPEDAATLIRPAPAPEPAAPAPPAPEAAQPAPAHFPLAERLPAAYSIQRVLGEGGMGAVFLAHHREWDVDLVLKVPRPEILDDPATAPRIRTEAAAWTSLGLHPHIVYCYFVLPVEEVPVLVIEYHTGGNLRQWLHARRGDLRESLDLAIQMCHGLEHAHRAGLVHRDIKPENILLSGDGTLKITDFGISLLDRAAPAPAAAGEGSMTVAGLGTRDYMAPEQWVDAHKVDGRADIFAFGVCLYEMLSGGRPYPATVGPRLEPPEPDRALPAPLRALMKQCVDWYRDARPAGFAAVRTALADIYRTQFGKASPFAELAAVSLEADGWNNRGVSYLELDQPEQALECFCRALAANPHHFEAARNRALLEWRRGAIDDTAALLVFEQLATHRAADKRTIALARAEVHQERFDPEEARKTLAPWPGLYEERFAHQELSRIGLTRSSRALKGWLAPTLSLTPDGRRALIANHTNAPEVWDADRLERLRTIGDPARPVNRLAISPGGRWGLLGLRDAALECWDLASGECVRKIEEPGAFQAVALGPDAVFAVGSAHALKQWDLTTGESARTLTGSQTAVACSLDGRIALSGGYDGKLALWDLARGQRLAELAGHTKKVTAIALSADGRRALTGSEDMTARLWDLENPRLLRTLTGHAYSLSGAAISADGRRGVSLSIDSKLHFWDLDSGRCLRTLHSPASIGAVALTADGRRCLALGGTGEILEYGIDLSRPYAAPLRPCRPLDFGAIREAQSRRDAALASAAGLIAQRGWTRAQDELLGAWAEIGYASEPRIEKLYEQIRQQGRRSRAVASRPLFSREDLGGTGNNVRVDMDAAARLCLVIADNTTLEIWDVARRERLRSLKGARNTTYDVALSADGRRAVASGDEKTVRLWDTATGGCLRSLEGHKNMVTRLTLSADGGLCVSAAAGAEAQLIVWDLEAGTPRHVLANHATNVQALALTLDGTIALSGSGDGALRITDTATGVCTGEVSRKHCPPRCVAALPGGSRALVNSPNGMELIDLANGAVIREMRHPRTVIALALSADGRHAVSGVDDATIRVWDLETGENLHTIVVPHPAIRLALSADASFLAAGHRGGLMTWWRLIWSREFPQ